MIGLIVSRGALLHGHFQLSSGLHSDQYVQCARLFHDPRDAETFGKALAKMAPKGVEVVVSPALGGLLIGYEVARALGVFFQFTERENGAMVLRRGFSVTPGRRVLVVEDVFTTGKSTLEVFAVLRGLNAQVVGALSVIDRGLAPGALGAPHASLVKLPLRAFRPEACPLCKEGKPLIKPGSRPLPLKTNT